MSITENQRRTLDLMAESAGMRWGDVEELSLDMFHRFVSSLTKREADQLLAALPHTTESADAAAD